MRKRSISLDTSGHTSALFRDAAVATCKAFAKKHGSGADIPILSHALSDNTGGAWVVRDIAGKEVAGVNSRMQVALIDAMGQGES
jgi:hypothetical protein